MVRHLPSEAQSIDPLPLPDGQSTIAVAVFAYQCHSPHYSVHNSPSAAGAIAIGQGIPFGHARPPVNAFAGDGPRMDAPAVGTPFLWKKKQFKTFYFGISSFAK